MLLDGRGASAACRRPSPRAVTVEAVVVVRVVMFRTLSSMRFHIAARGVIVEQPLEVRARRAARCEGAIIGHGGWRHSRRMSVAHNKAAGRYREKLRRWILEKLPEAGCWGNGIRNRDARVLAFRRTFGRPRPGYCCASVRWRAPRNSRGRRGRARQRAAPGGGVSLSGRLHVSSPSSGRGDAFEAADHSQLRPAPLR